MDSGLNKRSEKDEPKQLDGYSLKRGNPATLLFCKSRCWNPDLSSFPWSLITRQHGFKGLGAIGDSGLEFAQESDAYSVLLLLAEFLETRIAAQRVPERIEPEIAVRGAVRDFRGSFQLLDGEVALTRPGTDHGKNKAHPRNALREIWPPVTRENGLAALKR
jgi:hypothetical protein